MASLSLTLPRRYFSVLFLPALTALSYFGRVEALLRKSIGVSLSAKGSAKVKPAPPTAMGPLSEEGVEAEESEEANALKDAEWLDWKSVKEQMGQGHDEL